jgi:fatty-acid peroxygenase
VVSREDATPRLVAGPLFGHGAVHGLDGASHVHRKGLFVGVTRSPRPMELVGLAGAEWQSARERWRPGAGLVVEHEAVRFFGRAVFRWAGIDLPEAQVDRLAQRLATIVDGFAVPGPAYARAVLARRQTDAWAARLVEDVRDGTVEAAPGKALAIAAGWTDDAGELLPAKVAAVELQNVLRPTIAVSRFAAFAVLALAQHGDWRRRLASEEAAAAAQVGSDRRRVPSRDSSAWAFAHEVRRLTPFVPLLAGLTDVEVEHRGVRVPAGTRLLLDVVGTNRDPRFWDRPLDFDPGRFLDDREWERDALVPQGGGLVAAGHRCPGEDTTLGLIATTSAFFAGLSWTVPAQDLGVSSRRMPTRPASGTRVVLT